MGVETYQGYGLTETSPVIAVEHRKCSKPGSVGKLLPSLQGKIVDKSEHGVGEIVVKAPNIMIGY